MQSVHRSRLNSSRQKRQLRRLSGDSGNAPIISVNGLDHANVTESCLSVIKSMYLLRQPSKVST